MSEVHNVEAFNAKLTATVKDMGAEEVTILQRAIAVEAVGRIIEKTPVDTGRAVGNWQVSQTVAAKTKAAFLKGTRHGKQKTLTEAEKRELQDRTRLAGEKVIAGVTPYDIIWISNNVNYIERLEAGHSKVQALHGMVAVTLVELEAMYT